jgi:hypothetical protein
MRSRRRVATIVVWTLAAAGLVGTAAPAAAATGDARLEPGTQLGPGEQLMSANGLVTLTMTTAGDLVESVDGRGDVWSSGTRVPSSVARMQEDGNLVVIAPGNHPVWATATDRHPGSALELQDDGNVVVRGAGGGTEWASADHGGTLVAVPRPVRFTKYVALGDSFSSGEGIEPFYQRSDSCHRSERAYPTLVDVPGEPGTTVAEAMRAGSEDVQWGFQACSGAETTHAGSKSAGLEDEISADPTAADPKNDMALPLDAATTLVTLTIGGNNVDFSGVLEKCFFSENCTTEIFDGRTLEESIHDDRENLRIELAGAYAAIHAKAPNARILVAGYPQLFPASHAEQTCAKLAQRTVPLTDKSEGWSPAEQNFLRDQDVELNRLIRFEVESSPFAAAPGTSVPGRITFVPVADAFAGHEVCGSSGEWVNGPTATFTHPSQVMDGQFVNDQSFHPTSRGQKAYADAINAVLAASP